MEDKEAGWHLTQTPPPNSCTGFKPNKLSFSFLWNSSGYLHRNVSQTCPLGSRPVWGHEEMEQLWLSDFMDVLRRHFAFFGRGFSLARGPAGAIKYKISPKHYLTFLKVFLK